MEVDVPISVAYKCYSDREAIPEWMPFISTVKVCNAMLSLHLSLAEESFQMYSIILPSLCY